MDPCERAFDTPLLYEAGKLTVLLHIQTLMMMMMMLLLITNIMMMTYVVIYLHPLHHRLEEEPDSRAKLLPLWYRGCVASL